MPFVVSTPTSHALSQPSNGSAQPSLRRARRAIGSTVAALALSPLLVASPAQATPAAPQTFSVPAVSAPAAALAVAAAARTSTTASLVSLRSSARVSRSATSQSYASYAAALRSRAVSIAWGKVGARYRAGAAGPSSFDCSGFTMWVWSKAGRNLPHYSRAQYAALPKIRKSQLRPGDLVFFFRGGAHHVALYVGNGRIVHAANRRSGVKVSSLYESWYARHYSGAARVV